MNLIAQWNDEVNRRNVQFSVNYSVQNGGLSIDAINATKVCFLDQDGDSVTKSVGVHTTAGRRLLAEQLKSSGQMEDFSAEIARRCGLVAQNAN